MPEALGAPMHRRIPIPRGWRHHTKSAIVQILALSHFAFADLRAKPSSRRNAAPRGLAPSIAPPATMLCLLITWHHAADKPPRDVLLGDERSDSVVVS